MKTYTDFNNLPGPGDEETWGPCTGHPMDPRSPDIDGVFDDMRERMFHRRMEDTEYWVDAFGEASNEQLDALRQAFEQHELHLLIDAIYVICHNWMVPTDEEVFEELEVLRDAEDARREDQWDAERDSL